MDEFTVNQQIPTSVFTASDGSTDLDLIEANTEFLPPFQLSDLSP